MPEAAETSVIVCAFADERLADTVRCVMSARAQEPPPGEVIVVVDHNEPLAQRLREQLPAAVNVLANAGEQGLSAARNTGIAAAAGGLIAFLDDDAVAHPGWLAGLLAGLEDPSVIGVGGRANAIWDGGQPAWFPDEFLWVVGCSYTGQPQAGEVRNPLGCNMAFRAEVFAAAGGFDTGMGRLGKRPLGCEETELCLRASRRLPGTRFRLVAGAEIDHRVPQSRGRFRYFLSRCYHEGISKALVRTLADTGSLGTERTYVTRTLPAAVLRALAQVLTGPGRRAAAGRAGAVLAGLAASGLGYLRGHRLFRGREPLAGHPPPPGPPGMQPR